MKLQILKSEVTGEKQVTLTTNHGPIIVTTKADALTIAERESDRWSNLIDGRTITQIRETLAEFYALDLIANN